MGYLISLKQRCLLNKTSLLFVLLSKLGLKHAIKMAPLLIFFTENNDKLTSSIYLVANREIWLLYLHAGNSRVRKSGILVGKFELILKSGRRSSYHLKRVQP